MSQHGLGLKKEFFCPDVTTWVRGKKGRITLSVRMSQLGLGVKKEE
jgi:hypothetical protein